MAVNMKIAGLITIGLAAALAGAYQVGRSAALTQGPAPAPASTAQAVQTAQAGLAPTPGLPADHPSAAPPQMGGKVGADPDQAFTHFRVGNKNVKRIFVDADTVWVGTSGGVVRYDTRSDEYKLFDVQSGLLSNGVFHVSKLDGRIAVGTYGGGCRCWTPRARAGRPTTFPKAWATPLSTTCSRRRTATSGSPPGRASTVFAAAT
jgi:hypothetical protein